MTKFNFKAGIASFTSWYLLPTIRFGLWDHSNYTSKNRGGWLALTFLKFDAVLMWTTQK